MNKYKAVRTLVDGVLFDSKKEAAHYQNLRAMERCGVISGLECHKRYTLEVKGTKICDFEPDFVFMYAGGEKSAHDVKGLRKGSAYQLFRIKARLFEALYGVRVIEV